MSDYPEYLTQLFNAYKYMDGYDAQDAALHVIFSNVVKVLPSCINLTEEVALTLYRLYFACHWEPARTYFFLVTNILLDDDEPDLNINYGDALWLTPRTITGQCDVRCQALNCLFVDTSDADSSDSSSDSSDDEELDDETLASMMAVANGSDCESGAEDDASDDDADAAEEQ